MFDPTRKIVVLTDQSYQAGLIYVVSGEVYISSDDRTYKI